MRFTIEKEIFLKALARIQGIVERKNTIPILSNVLIEAKDDEILITATDLEVGMKASYPANISTPGKVTVSAKKLFEIVKELPEKEISFVSRENSWIEIRCGKSLFNIVGLSSDEFPYFPQPEKSEFIEIESSILKEMIDKTFFSISTDETKYNLNGIFFKTFEEGNKRYLRLVATDGHRLSLIQRPLDIPQMESLSRGIIFPKKGVSELKKITEEPGDILHLGFMDNNAVVKKDRTVVVMRLVDGEFPDYTRVIPKEKDNGAEIKTLTLLHGLRRMSILSSEKSRGVKLSLKKGILEISSSNPELGDAREELDIEFSGEELSIGFNARYLMDILQAMDEDLVKLIIKDHLSPGLLMPVKDDNYLAVVMPMRL